MPTTENQPNQINRDDKPSLFSKCIATAFFAGYSPIAPGTAGSLIALIPLFFFPGIRTPLLALLIVIVFLAGRWVAKKFEDAYGDDPQIVVIDEVVGMWITMVLVPITLFNLVAGFVLFRFFDIVKPPPARQLERLQNGWGIMLDDVAAGIYAGLVLFIITIII
jgi:phosphatidylglycerophosphatase A